MNRLITSGATVTRVRSAADCPGAIREFLDAHELPGELVISGDPVPAGIDWPGDLAISRRGTSGDDPTSVTGAVAGLAETGSVVLTSGPDTPTTLNFLPDNHVVLLGSQQICAHLEDAFTRIRADGDMPRAINLVTGPSKTADVAQVLQHGAHGPRRLHVIVIG